VSRIVALVIRRVGMDEAFAEGGVVVLPEFLPAPARAGARRAEMVGVDEGCRVGARVALDPRERAVRAADIICLCVRRRIIDLHERARRVEDVIADTRYNAGTRALHRLHAALVCVIEMGLLSEVRPGRAVTARAASEHPDGLVRHIVDEVEMAVMRGIPARVMRGPTRARPRRIPVRIRVIDEVELVLPIILQGQVPPRPLPGLVGLRPQVPERIVTIADIAVERVIGLREGQATKRKRLLPIMWKPEELLGRALHGKAGQPAW